MGKISPVTNKYTIVASFKSQGTVEKPDIIGAIFGQTEGLLGTELELRELQKSGRIGRIDVEFNKTNRNSIEGRIMIPSSLSQAETALIAATVETITRVGPADAKIEVERIDDIRVSKRKYVLERAKELLKKMVETTMPDTKEISDEVFKSVRTMEIIKYGEDKLPAGPDITQSEEVILVEGRADVVNLLKYGFRNVISMDGSHVPKTIIKLSKEKEMTVFIDGDRGGELIVTELKKVSEVDFVSIAPQGKEVEELTGKEIHKALRAKVPLDQMKFEGTMKNRFKNDYRKREETMKTRRVPKKQEPIKLSKKDMGNIKKYGEDLIGSQGSYILDKDLKLLGKVPVTELVNSLRELEDFSGVVIDGVLSQEMAEDLDRVGVVLIACRENESSGMTNLKILTFESL